MISTQEKLLTELKAQGIVEPALLAAFSHIPREKFVTASDQESAYENKALPIDCQQTISQPYIVGIMTQFLLQHVPTNGKILEIGTGSGYQAAILAELFPHIWTIERIPSLSHSAQKTLAALGYTSISFKIGNGAQGWPEQAPFDGILVTAAPIIPPPALLAQLNPNGGTMIIPLGAQNKVQKLTLIVRTHDHFKESVIESVSFVPFI